jgi:hypothetical protein
MSSNAKGLSSIVTGPNGKAIPLESLQSRYGHESPVLFYTNKLAIELACRFPQKTGIYEKDSFAYQANQMSTVYWA